MFRNMFKQFIGPVPPPENNVRVVFQSKYGPHANGGSRQTKLLSPDMEHWQKDVSSQGDTTALYSLEISGAEGERELTKPGENRGSLPKTGQSGGTSAIKSATEEESYYIINSFLTDITSAGALEGDRFNVSLGRCANFGKCLTYLS
ncbi:unnamed protein product [Pieris macdunnoughi]|uniref:Uncharacterized protein n=1 Tax=Pieris macdunnoughi TaxID=345717 RepID=A0A821MXW7_9NEOP|nr:unnamed protein product [Pieris macdunnoughi]